MSGAEPRPLVQWREALRWLSRAAEDQRIAHFIAAEEEVLGGTAFHVRQATTEKILKALLVAASADFRRVHDLEELASLAHRHWPDVVPSPFPLARTSLWYVSSRYPGVDDILPDAGDVTIALGQVDALMEAVRGLVPPVLRIGGEPDTH
jgi:HEPN domain-containing protein